MYLINFQEPWTRKELKRPAARLTGTVRPVLSRPFISLEKMGASDALECQQLFIKKSNRKLLDFPCYIRVVETPVNHTLFKNAEQLIKS